MDVVWFVLGLCWLGLPATVSGNSFGLQMDHTGWNFNITVNGTVWLHSAAPFLYRQGQRLTVDNKSILLLESIKFQSHDSIGRYDIWRHTYRTNNSEDHLQFRWNVQNYSSGFADTLVVFDQIYTDGVNDTQAPSNVKTIAGWPGFDRTPQLSLDLGFLTFAGGMLGSENLTVGRWNDGTLVLPDGLEGSGPLCLFDTQGNTIIISSMSNFMAANMWREREEGRDSLYWGVMQGVNDLPPGFSHRTMLYYSPYGINQAFRGWGAVLRKMYGKPDAPDIRRDVTLQYLGYYTNYGSYYYRNLPSGRTWRDVLTEVKQKLHAKNISISYFQLDDWWYTEDLRKAVISWSPSVAAFPDGLESFYNVTSMPLVARGTVWSLQNNYDTANSGRYSFVRGRECSVPNDPNFWNFLLNKTAWGLATYEQDNMKEQMLGVPEFKTDLNLGRNWLTQMGSAAGNNSVNILYSDALPRQALQSLEVSSVTQARVSADYQRQQGQWRIGVMSMLAWSLGLAPFKDAFWVASRQPGNQLYNEEPYPELQSVVATLSWGPVAIGDNPDVITTADFISKNRCCRTDGVILRPDRPATAIDSQILQMALGGAVGVRGEVWTTEIDMGTMAFGLILAVDVVGEFSVTPSSAFNSRFPGGKIYELTEPPVLRNFSEHSPLSLRGCGASVSRPFCLYAVSSIITIGDHEIVLIGDVSKWVPLSSKRFRGVTRTGTSSFKVSVTGAPGENFNFYYELNGHMISHSVHIPEAGSDRVEFEILPQPSTTPQPSTSRTTPATSPVTGAHHNATGPVGSAVTAHVSMVFPVLVAMASWVTMGRFSK